MLYRHGGRTYLTPMLLCVIAVGTADVMFAVDSIPAIYSLTNEAYLVFAATAFSLLGLRQLYFLIDGLLDRIIFLHYGLAAILGFIGFKLDQPRAAHERAALRQRRATHCCGSRAEHRLLARLHRGHHSHHGRCLPGGVTLPAWRRG
jgi:hypothetical protein